MEILWSSSEGPHRSPKALPWEIILLSKAGSLAFEDQGWSGTISSRLDKLSKLVILELQSNRLTGTIPSAMGNMNDLQFVSLSDNFLVGTIPTSLTELDILLHFDVSKNQLSGNIPTFPKPIGGDLVESHYLDFSCNNFTGSVGYYCLYPVFDHNKFFLRVDCAELTPCPCCSCRQSCQ